MGFGGSHMLLGTAPVLEVDSQAQDIGLDSRAVAYEANCLQFNFNDGTFWGRQNRVAARKKEVIGLITFNSPGAL